MIKTRVRFNLAKGDNYLKWQVKQNGEVSYYDPATTSLRLIGCELKNHRNTAEKIFGGEDKSVCAWVNCERIEIIPQEASASEWVRVSFNPKVQPFWTIDGKNVDGFKIEELISNNRALYASPKILEEISD